MAGGCMIPPRRWTINEPMMRSVGLTHELVNLVRQQGPIHGVTRGCDRRPVDGCPGAGDGDSFVKGEQGWHVHLERTADGLNKGFGFHRELPYFVDNQHLTVVLCMVDGRQSHTVQFFRVDAVTEHTESGINVFVGDDALFSVTMSMIL